MKPEIRKRWRSVEILGGAPTTSGKRATLAVISVGSVLILWTALGSFGLINNVLVPSPADVGRAAVIAISDGSLLKNAVASLLRVVQGFAVATLIAIPLGMLMGVSRTARGLFDPLIELLRPVPPIAFIPLAILWFGIGEFSKVMIIAYGAFFPIFVNTMAGFESVDQVHIRAAQTLGAKRYDIFKDVILPSAFPQMVTGARLGMGMAFIVLVAAELVASSEGLGYLINDARFSFRTDQIFVGMIAIGLLGLILNKALLETERRMLRWKFV
jgi:ABC-type nitrate/sulfonate/bicarbonate transport system permease component